MELTGVVLAAFLVLTLQSDNSASARRVPTGEWGGPHARLDVQEKGARLELDCAHGTLDGALRLDRDGRFRAKGLLQREGGPEMAQEAAAEGRPAQYSGTLKGNVLTLRILTEDELKLGPFTLERGGRAELVKCQ
jgi:hypothetical protein